MAAAAAATLAGTGCAFMPSLYVISPGTDHYLDGVEQQRQPDGWLPEGTKIWVLRKDEGYSKVFTEDGDLTWVWNGAVARSSEYKRRQKAGNSK